MKAQGGQYGVKETIEVVKLGGALLKAGKNIWADKKIGMDDLGHLMAAVPHVQPAVDNIGLVPKEVSELDSDDAAKIVAAFDDEFGTGEWAKIGAHALQIGLHALAIVKLVKE